MGDTVRNVLKASGNYPYDLGHCQSNRRVHVAEPEFNFNLLGSLPSGWAATQRVTSLGLLLGEKRRLHPGTRRNPKLSKYVHITPNTFRSDQYPGNDWKIILGIAIFIDQTASLGYMDQEAVGDGESEILLSPFFWRDHSSAQQYQMPMWKSVDYLNYRPIVTWPLQ